MSCLTCPRSGPVLRTEGTGRTGVMIVADHLEVDPDAQMPGRIDKTLAGYQGRILATQLTRLNLRWSDFYTAAACFCAPPKAELFRATMQCSALDVEIARTRPKVFLTLGTLAFERLTGERVPPLLARGYVWPALPRYGGWVVPALPPTYYAQDPGMLLTWIEDVKKALKVAQLGDRFAYCDPGTLYDTPNIAQWDALVSDFMHNPCQPLGVDTEFPWKRRQDMSEEEKAADLDLTDQIDYLNLAWGNVGVSVPWQEPYLEGALKVLHASQEVGTSLFWNAPADTGRLTANGGPVFRASHTIDLMDMFRCWRNCVRRKLGIAVTLFPSLWNVRPWKHLGTDDAYYRPMDSVALVKGYADMTAGLAAEGAALAYDTLFTRLDPLLEAATATGLAVDGPKVAGLSVSVAADLQARQREMTSLVPVSVRTLDTWVGEAAAERARQAAIAAGELPADTMLEQVPATRKTRKCSVCGLVDVPADHCKRVYLKPLDALATPMLSS